MRTGYSIRKDRIYGPKHPGEFWIQDNSIHGPRNSGLFRIENKRIHGPNNSGKFWIDDDGHIHGPSKNVPWLHEGKRARR